MKFARCLLLLLFIVVSARTALAHCDTLAGPVARDARVAMQKGDVTTVLKWVRASDEDEVRRAFARAMAVRNMGGEARELGETYFLETLIRVHRAGEGMPYSGIKTEENVEPGIEAADKALETGSAERLATEASTKLASGIQARFERVVAARRHATESIPAGREYVASYVDFIHFVERAHQLTGSTAGVHSGDEQTGHAH